MIPHNTTGDNIIGLRSLPSPVGFPSGNLFGHFAPGTFPEATARPSINANPFLCSPGHVASYLSVSPTSSLGCLPSTSPPQSLGMGASLVGRLSLHPATSYPPPTPRQLPHPSHSLPPLHHHLPLALALSSDSYFSLSSPNSSGLSSPTSHLPNPSSLVHTRSAFLFPHTSSSSSSPSSSLHRPQDVRMEPHCVVVSDL